MTEPNSLYRTLIRGSIEQITAFALGGSPGVEENSDGCYRDGRDKLMIPGTSLAGALIEAGARVFPRLITSDFEQSLLQGRITGKRLQAPKPGPKADSEAATFQSIWKFRNARLSSSETRTEWRQGVGIRQATGASAGQKKALYDFEVVPVGAAWGLFLEIDTYRGGAEAEALAVLALNEWVQGRGWLGRGPARGTGWFRLTIDTVLRLPRTHQVLEVWPDNTLPLDEALQAVQPLGALLTWSDAIKDARVATADWQQGTWHFLGIPILLGPGRGPEDYGWDVLQVGGHPAGELNPSLAGIQEPLSVRTSSDQSADWHGRNYKLPDAPFVSTQPTGKNSGQPFLPGGGIRGPLRHTASRLERSHDTAVRDPNRPDDPEAKRLRAEIDQRRTASGMVHDAEVRAMADVITELFGTEELCGRVLVSDAELTGPHFRVARVEHHAEDEFSAGVYGTSKFDRNVLSEGPMRFRIVLEAPNPGVLQSMARKLLPTLELARLGHMPLGGGKWRGAGWVSWTVGPLELSRAGGTNTIHEEDNATTHSLTERVERLFTWREPEHD